MKNAILEWYEKAKWSRPLWTPRGGQTVLFSRLFLPPSPCVAEQVERSANNAVLIQVSLPATPKMPALTGQ